MPNNHNSDFWHFYYHDFKKYITFAITNNTFKVV